MVSAIDQVLQNQYTTNLANEFPKFTWNNYFLNDGTYTRSDSVYPDISNPSGAPTTETEWQLFRSKLFYPRSDWSGSDPRSSGIPNAAGLVDQVKNYPASSQTSPFAPQVGNLGAAYVEFLPNSSIGATDILSVTFGIYLAPPSAAQVARVSVLPVTNFVNSPHPSNVFLNPLLAQPSGTSSYTFQIVNFKQCDRVALIANNVLPPFVYNYGYAAEVITPAMPTTSAPCSLVLP